MDLSVASSLHGNKITAGKDLEKSVPEIRNITGPSLHAFASHHRDHKNTWHTPFEIWQNPQENVCRAHGRIMHTKNHGKK